MLENMRVVSFTHWLQGPATGQYLSDMGAEVVRVEPPGGGFERNWVAAGRTLEGTGTLYLAANRNARSIVIDLKKPGGREVAVRLIENSDVLLENYRPGVMDRLGLGYDDMKEVNPGLIYASATGYGADGPLSKRPGQDLLVQARTGMIAATGEYGEHPTASGAAIVDQHGAALLAMAISAAFANKLTTGEGARIEGTLFTAATDLFMESLTHYFSLGHERSALKRDRHLATWSNDSPYGVYELADAFIVVSINDFGRLGEALGSDRVAALAEKDAFADRDEVTRIFAEELEIRTFAEVEAGFDRVGIWYEKVRDYEDLRTDPQTAHAQIFREVAVGNSTATIVNHPIRYNGKVPEMRRLTLLAGENSREVMGELGYGQPEIDALIEAGVVIAPDRQND